MGANYGNKSFSALGERRETQLHGFEKSMF